MSKIVRIGALAVLLIAAAAGAVLFFGEGPGKDAGSVADGGRSAAPAQSDAPKRTTVPESPADVAAKRDLLALMLAYPGQISGVEKDGAAVCAVMRSGRRIAYDDGREKTFEEKLADADLQDMMEQIYPLGDIDGIREGNLDPGRIRCYAFFEEVYGKAEDAVRANLTNVALGGGNCLFNENNGAAAQLEKAFDEVADLIENDAAVSGFVYPLSGTFNYRVIAGTDQLSPHAFGIAIDLHSDARDYWRWATREQGQSRLTEYPRDLVRAFEDNGFIWGGKWAHFDILHFEYRPELLMKARHCVAPDKTVSPWYAGYPDTEQVLEAVAVIDRAWAGE